MPNSRPERQRIEPGMKEKVWEEWFGFPAMRMVTKDFRCLINLASASTFPKRF